MPMLTTDVNLIENISRLSDGELIALLESEALRHVASGAYADEVAVLSRAEAFRRWGSITPPRRIVQVLPGSEASRHGITSGNDIKQAMVYGVCPPTQSHPASGKKGKIKKILLGIFAVITLLVAGGSFWAYSNGYYHALRGGIVQDKDLDKAIYFFKKAYEKNPGVFMVAHDIACCYALKGDKENCFYWLRLALKARYGNYAKKWAKTEKDFDPVRETAEFQALIYDAQK